MHYKVITAVTAEPVTLAEARLQCKVDSDDTTHDALLSALITAAREYAEHYTGRALAPQTLELALDAFPDEIDLPMPPVASITSITYVDTAGDTQTLATDKYALSTYGDSRTVSLTYGNTWPSTRDIPDAVKVKYLTGYSTCPKAAKAAILLEVESQFPLNSYTPAERADRDRARDSLLNTIRLYGY